MARIGIFGGTFNPPHMGHVQAVTAAREELGLDRVLLIPAAVPPHKQLPPHSPDADMRLELTRLAVAQLPRLRGCDLHSTQMLHSGDESILRKLHMNVTCEPVFPDKNLLL